MKAGEIKPLKTPNTKPNYIHDDLRWKERKRKKERKKERKTQAPEANEKWIASDVDVHGHVYPY